MISRKPWHEARTLRRLMPIVSGAMALALIFLLAPSIYTLAAISGFAPMTVPIFLGWLGWLQLVHVAGGAVIWKRRRQLSTRMKAALLSWGGLAFWYWLLWPERSHSCSHSCRANTGA